MYCGVFSAGDSYGDVSAAARTSAYAGSVHLADEIDEYLGTTYRKDPAVRKLITYHYTNWSRRYPLNDSEYTTKHYNRAKVCMARSSSKMVRILIVWTSHVRHSEQ